MDQSLQINKGLSTEVRVLLADGQEIQGRFFLAENARNHLGQENLLDLVNDPGKIFLPFCPKEGDNVILVRKSRIRGLQLDLDDHGEGSMEQGNHEQNWLPAEISMAGMHLEGHANTGGLPPERRRLADLLNHEDAFIEFESDYGPWILNKNHLNYLVPLA